jgi:hypothetical protein
LGSESEIGSCEGLAVAPYYILPHGDLSYPFVAFLLDGRYFGVSSKTGTSVKYLGESP